MPTGFVIGVTLLILEFCEGGSGMGWPGWAGAAGGACVGGAAPEEVDVGGAVVAGGGP